MDLNEEESVGDPIILDYVKYQDVTNLVIFVSKNVDEVDVTEMGGLELYGTPNSTVDMDKLQEVNKARQEKKKERKKGGIGNVMRNSKRG
jgi:hypothetical protein